MRGGFGGMLSVRFRKGGEKARAVAANLRVFKRATSLGAVESLVEHRASIEGEGTLCPDDLLRFSIGIEPLDDLLNDLYQAIGS
jgi:cystathionine gamma-synthase